MARANRLDNAEFCKSVAEAYIKGMSRDEMAEEFNCHRDTITNWVQDPRVQAHAGRFALERVNRITRRIDAAMEGRLAHVDKMDVDTLLKIRKEYLERALKIDLGQIAVADTTNELLEAMDQDPGFAEKLAELVGK